MSEKWKIAVAAMCSAVFVGCFTACMTVADESKPSDPGTESSASIGESTGESMSESETESGTGSESESESERESESVKTAKEIAGEAIAALPATEEVSLADEERIAHARELVNALSAEDAADLDLGRLEAAENALALLKQSRYTGEREVWTEKGATEVSLPLDLKNNAVKKVTLRGKPVDVTAEKSGDNTIFDEKLTALLRYGANTLAVEDTAGNTFSFVVYSAVSKGDIAFFDFDVNGYSNDDPYAVPSGIEADGIEGRSLHLKKNGAGGNLFGFFADGANGMAKFNFLPDTEYRLYFDIRVLEGTSSDWWCPIRFGDNGDVIYLYDDYAWKNPDVNVLYTQTTVTENEDGSRRVTAIFRTTSASRSLDIPNWGGKVNILLDNVCVEKLNPDLRRIACVGDSITEASNTDFSYPEQLQAMLGYDEYFVFNFGKSASNVLGAGAYPYRTWAEWQYEYLKKWNPDTIVMMLGTNDGRFTTGIADYKDKRFIDDYMSLVNEFKEMCKKFYINISPYAFGNEYGINASDVNDRIVNIQGYLAYENGIDVIDVHAAVKAVSRADYFPDYIHGNDAGYGVIARAVEEGLAGKKTVTKYHLLYALQTASDRTGEAYLAAKAVSENASATQEEIDAAYLSIRDDMEIPELAETQILDRNAYLAEDGGNMLLPVVVRNEEILSLYVGGNEINVNLLSAGENGVSVPVSELSSLKKGAYKAELDLSVSGTIDAIFYVGYGSGEALLIDSKVNTYVNTNEWLMPNEIGTEFDGACMHFFRKDKDVTLLGVDSLASFGFIRYTFKPATRYTLSFDYKFGAKTSGSSFFYFNDASSTRICDWGVPDVVSTTDNSAKANVSVTQKGDAMFFRAAFTTPDMEGNISLNLPCWFQDLDLYIDNFFLCEGEDGTVDVAGKPSLAATEIYAATGEALTIPVKSNGATLQEVKIGGVKTEGFAANAENIVLSAETVSALGTGAFSCELVYEKTTLNLLLYVGYEKGEIYCLDNVVNKYVNTDSWMWKNDIVDGKEGRKWLHLYNEAAWLTIFGMDANGSFGWVKFAFKPGTEYTMSFDFYYDEMWGKPMSGGTKLVIADSIGLCTLNADYSVVKSDAISAEVTENGDHHTLTVTFLTPSVVGNISFQMTGSFSNGSVYMGNLIVKENKN